MNVKTVELHLLQSFPPSCVNRDGNNSPKDCTFGNVRRARISSQCLKRAIRQAESFAEAVGGEIASRSKQLRDYKLVPHLKGQGLGQEEAEKIADDFRLALSKPDKKPNQTAVGLYFGDPELFALLAAFRSGDKKWMETAAPKSADVALFGRMLAEATDLSVDAACQVAHAFSTHRLSQESDYWTAADDLKGTHEGDDAGASMIGVSEFNASVFYRYACVNLPILASNLGDPAVVKSAVDGFLRASYDAIPTGKLNGHAHFNPPVFAVLVIRQRGMPLNLANAFLAPVGSKSGPDVAAASADALLAHLKQMRKMSLVDDASYYYAHALAVEPNDSGIDKLASYGALVAKAVEALG
jgi:CRISPR system Cascade subunit CasC